MFPDLKIYFSTKYDTSSFDSMAVAKYTFSLIKNYSSLFKFIQIIEI